MSDLAILIPAFNEAESLPNLIAECLSAGFQSSQMAVINDGSRDNTADVMRSQSGVTLLDLPINLGIGGAMQTGYKWACARGFRYAIQVDGDGQHDPAQIPPLLKLARRESAAMVVGSRFVGTQRQGFQSTWLRRVGIFWFSKWIGLLTGQKILDTTSGLRLCERRLMDVFAAEYPSDYPEPETLALTLALGLKVLEHPVVMRSRSAGQSSIAGFRSAYYMVKVTLGIFFGYIQAKQTRREFRDSTRGPL